MMAGLLDVHQLCDNRQAVDVVTKMAGWVAFRVDRLTDDQMQASLGTEFGGMNEVLANLYAATGNAAYLRIARKFEHKAIFDPLLRHDDPLNGLHANTQFPKIIGAAREYELTGEPRYRDIATFFWDRVVDLPPLRSRDGGSRSPPTARRSPSSRRSARRRGCCSIPDALRGRLASIEMVSYYHAIAFLTTMRHGFRAQLGR